MLGRSVQQRIYLEGLLGRKPPVPVHPEALEKAASKRMSPEAFAYVAGGAGLERTMAANRQAFDRYRLLPRMLRGAKPPGLEVELWGRRWAAPLFLCPIGVLELAHPEADLAAARAAARTGVPFMVLRPGPRGRGRGQGGPRPPSGRAGAHPRPLGGKKPGGARPPSPRQGKPPAPGGRGA
jgi:hypothetical protein